MRAVAKATPILQNYNYKTGIDKQADAEAGELINELLLQINTGCDESFKEYSFFDRIHSDEEQE